MKKILKMSLFFLMTVVMSGVVCSCGDEDSTPASTPEIPTSDKGIVGKWTAPLGRGNTVILVFNNNGTGSVSYNNETRAADSFSFTWKKLDVKTDLENVETISVTASNNGETCTSTYRASFTKDVMLDLTYVKADGSEYDKDSDVEDELGLASLSYFKEGANAVQLYDFCGSWSYEYEDGSHADLTINNDGTGNFTFTDTEDASNNESTDFTWKTEDLLVTTERGDSYMNMALVITTYDADASHSGAYCYNFDDEEGTLRIWPMIGQEVYFEGSLDIESIYFNKKK